MKRKRKCKECSKIFIGRSHYQEYCSDCYEKNTQMKGGNNGMENKKVDELKDTKKSKKNIDEDETKEVRREKKNINSDRAEKIINFARNTLKLDLEFARKSIQRANHVIHKIIKE